MDSAPQTVKKPASLGFFDKTRAWNAAIARRKVFFSGMNPEKNGFDSLFAERRKLCEALSSVKGAE